MTQDLSISAARTWRKPLSGTSRSDISPRTKTAEISGHYHPNMPLRVQRDLVFSTIRGGLSCPLLAPTLGGLSSDAAPLKALFPHGAIAVLTGKSAIATPLGKNQRPQDSRGMSYYRHLDTAGQLDKFLIPNALALFDKCHCNPMRPMRAMTESSSISLTASANRIKSRCWVPSSKKTTV